jgi:MFS family permease
MVSHPQIVSIWERLTGGRVFYGWSIVGIAFSASMITAGISGYGLSFFLIPMSEELGVSRAEFSTITLFRLASLPIIPILGLLVDKKHGPRLLLTFGSILAGLTLILTSRVETLWQFFIVFGVIFSIAVFTMGGQLVGPAVLAKWFVRRRGRVMAISAVGISGGGLVVAPIAGWLVNEFGWRSAWVVLGVVMIATISPMAALFMRRQPEDIGLLPDGAKLSTANESGPNNGVGPSVYEYPWTVRQALQTRALWILVGVQSLAMAALMPVLFHQVAYVQDKGFGLPTAAAVATTLAGFAIVGKLVYGYLVERIAVRWVLALSLVPAGLSLFLLVGATGVEVLYAYAITHGLFMGGFPPLMNVAFAEYFGRHHLGAIRGVITPIGNVVAAVSPVAVGWMWVRTGSYDAPFVALGVAWIVGGLLALSAAAPKLPSDHEDLLDTSELLTESAV